MAVDPTKIQSVLTKATDQQLMAMLKRPDSIPSMFVQQEIRRRNMARQAAKADLAKLNNAQKPQLPPQMTQAVPMNTGGSGRLAEQKRTLMQMYKAGRMNIVQGVAENDQGELGQFARELLSADQLRPTDNKGLDVNRKPLFTDYDMTNPRNNFPGSRLNYSIAPMIQKSTANNEGVSASVKSEFMSQLENAGIKAINEATPMNLENEYLEGQFDPEGKFDYGRPVEGSPVKIPEFVRPNIPYTTTLDRTAIPQGPDYAEQKFQGANPSGYRGDPRLALESSTSGLGDLVERALYPPADSGRILATNQGDLDQARNLIKGESGFGNISSTSGLEVPDSSDKAPINDIFKGIATIGGEPTVPVSQGGITSDRFLMENDVMTPEYMDYLAKRNRANKRVADSIQTDNALFTEKGYTPPTRSGSASYLPGDRRIIAKGPDFAYEKFKRGMPTGKFEESGYAQEPILPDGTSRSLDVYNIIKDEIAEGLDNEFLNSTIFKSPGDIRDVRKNIIGLGAGMNQDKFKSGGNLKEIFTPLPTESELKGSSYEKESGIANASFPDSKNEVSASVKVDSKTTPTPIDINYVKEWENANASFADSKQASNEENQNDIKKEVANLSGPKKIAGGQMASEMSKLTNAQNQLIEAMKPAGDASDRFWELVANFGARIWASDKPNLMQATGDAMQQTLVEHKELKGERRDQFIAQAKMAVDLEFQRANLGLQLARLGATSGNAAASLSFRREELDATKDYRDSQISLSEQELELKKERLGQDRIDAIIKVASESDDPQAFLKTNLPELFKEDLDPDKIN